MLASPIILYDYPQVAPESRNAFFDGAEIDELLTLRVRTLSDDEKREMAAADPRTREILQRCESMTPDELGALHGVFRSQERPIAELSVGGRVRIAPKAGGDIMDIALCGKIAVVAAIERDLEGRAHVAVTLVDDPGADLGAAGFPGHRFFFSPQELEPLEGGAP
jgi:hydrogenase maturation protease